MASTETKLLGTLNFQKKGGAEGLTSIHCLPNISTLISLLKAVENLGSLFKLLHITEAVQLFGIPKAKFYQAINSGALRYYQFEGNAKKYLMVSDIQQWIEEHAVIIPSDSDSFNAFEQELRKQTKRGDEIVAKLEAHTGNSPPSNLSELATALWQCGIRTKELKNIQLSTNSRKAFK